MNRTRIMIVEDSTTMRAMLEQVISTDTTCRVVGMAADVNSALQLMTKIWPDVLTLDLTMPGVDGFAFLRAIRGRRHPPVVVVSSRSKADAAETARALAAGAVACFDKAELLTVVPSFLKCLKRVAAPKKIRIKQRSVPSQAIEEFAVACA